MYDFRQMTLYIILYKSILFDLERISEIRTILFPNLTVE